MAFYLSHYNYLVSFVLMAIGLFGMINNGNLVKKLIGLAIFQVSVLLFYISMAKVRGGKIPLIKEASTQLYSNPIPHVLMLTAIVVGVSTLAVGMSIVVRIKKAYGSVEEQEILEMDKLVESDHGQFEDDINGD